MRRVSNHDAEDALFRKHDTQSIKLGYHECEENVIEK